MDVTNAKLAAQPAASPSFRAEPALAGGLIDPSKTGSERPASAPHLGIEFDVSYVAEADRSVERSSPMISQRTRRASISSARNPWPLSRRVGPAIGVSDSWRLSGRLFRPAERAGSLALIRRSRPA